MTGTASWASVIIDIYSCWDCRSLSLHHVFVSERESVCVSGCVLSHWVTTWSERTHIERAREVVASFLSAILEKRRRRAESWEGKKMKVAFFRLSPIASHFSRSRHARCDRERERERSYINTWHWVNWRYLFTRLEVDARRFLSPLDEKSPRDIDEREEVREWDRASRKRETPAWVWFASAVRRKAQKSVMEPREAKEKWLSYPENEIKSNKRLMKLLHFLSPSFIFDAFHRRILSHIQFWNPRAFHIH